jgi:hypothetical protein
MPALISLMSYLVLSALYEKIAAGTILAREAISHLHDPHWRSVR